MKKVLVIVVLFVCGVFCLRSFLFADDKSKAIYYTTLNGKASQTTEILLEKIEQINQLNKNSNKIYEKYRELEDKITKIREEITRLSIMDINDELRLKYTCGYGVDLEMYRLDDEYGLSRILSRTMRLLDEEAIKLRDYLIRIYGTKNETH